MVKKEGGKSLKTFNLNKALYEEYSEYCKKHGISMSKRVENFIKMELDKLHGNLIDRDNKVKDFKGEEHSFKRYC